MKNLERKQDSKGKAYLIIKTLGSTTKEEFYADGSSLLLTLQMKHNIRISKSFSGTRLDCIESVCAKNGFWWKLYADGKPLQVSADNYYPKKGETILIEYGDGR